VQTSKTHHKLAIAPGEVLLQSQLNTVLLPYVTEGSVKARYTIPTDPLLHEVGDVLSQYCVDGLYELCIRVCVCVCACVCVCVCVHVCVYMEGKCTSYSLIPPFQAPSPPPSLAPPLLLP